MFVCGACGQRYDAGGFCSSDGAQLTATTDPLLGTEVGRYRLASLLGEGGMGAVYLGVQPRIGSRVAIKVLSAECTRNAELYQRFLSEARAVNMIKHEHIVGVVDMAELPDGRPYIVMEFVEGQTLGALVRTEQGPLGGIVQVITEMLSALDAAHALGIVHRDLKPDNVLVTAQGHAKVLDFGIAKLAPGLGSTSSPRTKTGALLGTPAYMAPEQISGAGNVDARTDVYAAGVVLFEAVTGRVPFHGESLFDLMRAHLEQAPPSPRQVRPDLPASFEHVILTALAKDPNARFQSASAMSAALQHAARELPAEQWHAMTRPRPISLAPRSHVTPVDPQATTHPNPAPYFTERTEPRSHSRRGLWMGLGAVAVVGTTIGVLVATKGGGHPEIVAASESGSGSESGSASGSGSGSASETVAATGSAAGAGPGSSTPPAPASRPRVPSTAAKPTAPTSTVPTAQAATPGPDIVGGGSAAAHGVHIGQGVSIGQGVVIGGGSASPGTTPKSRQFSRPIDYNPKKFDATAYAPKALALARSVVPDAGFVRMDIAGVFPTGLADLTLTDDDSTYWFRSPASSVRPAGIPKNQDVDIACYVEVKVGAKSIDVWVRDLSPIDTRCKWPLRPLPRCSLAKVWTQAKTKGADPDTFAKIAFLSDGAWFFDNDGDSYDGITETIADQCP